MLSGEHNQVQNILDESGLLMKKKNRAAVQLGGLGGKATAQKRTTEQRQAHARKAALARWARVREAPVD